MITVYFNESFENIVPIIYGAALCGHSKDWSFNKSKMNGIGGLL